ncbi:hypothetical protein V6U89_20620 [Micromonospora sp. CPCC 206171]
MAARTPARTTPTSAGVWLPNHAYDDQENQSSTSRSSPRAMDCGDGGCPMNAMIRVSAKTKTRSKKISKVVAGWSRATRAAGPRAENRTAPPPVRPADWIRC